MELTFERIPCVCVRPRLAASSALSGSAKYCVFENRLISSCSWYELNKIRQKVLLSSISSPVNRSRLANLFRALIPRRPIVGSILVIILDIIVLTAVGRSNRNH